MSAFGGNLQIPVFFLERIQNVPLSPFLAKPSDVRGEKGKAVSVRGGLVLYLEDGFFCSFGAGDQFPQRFNV